MKILILIFVCLLFMPCQAAERQNQQQTGEPNQQKEIEQYIACRHNEIENYYKGRLIEVQQRAQSEIILLEVAETATSVSPASLAAQARVAEAVLCIDGYGCSRAGETERMLPGKYERKSYFVYQDSIDKSPQQFAEAHCRIAERKSHILAKMEWETVNLEQKKQYALTIGLSQLEKQLKEDVIRPQSKATNDVVTGVLYSEDKPSAIVDHKIVHEGDTIDSVTVVKIYKDKVEFEKNNKKWEQKVQQSPEANWR